MRVILMIQLILFLKATIGFSTQCVKVKVTEINFILSSFNYLPEKRVRMVEDRHFKSMRTN